MFMLQLAHDRPGQPRFQWTHDNSLPDSQSSGSQSENERIQKDDETTAAILSWFFTWAANYLINTNDPCIDGKFNKFSTADVTSLREILQYQWLGFVSRRETWGRVYMQYRKQLQRLETVRAQRPVAKCSDGAAAIHSSTIAEEAAEFALGELHVHVEFVNAMRALLHIVPSEAAVERAEADTNPIT
jgi:hypothetical protein